VIDSVHAGARAIARALTGPDGDRARVAEAPMTGLSAPLADLLARG
jgi:hypothetical protein